MDGDEILKMNDIRVREIETRVDKNCSILSPQERATFKSFMIKNDSLMKELSKL